MAIGNETAVSGREGRENGKSRIEDKRGRRGCRHNDFPGLNTLVASACEWRYKVTSAITSRIPDANYTVCTDVYHVMEALNIFAAGLVHVRRGLRRRQAQLAQNLNLHN